MYRVCFSQISMNVLKDKPRAQRQQTVLIRQVLTAATARRVSVGMATHVLVSYFTCNESILYLKTILFYHWRRTYC